jgi:hypothetical protein
MLTHEKLKNRALERADVKAEYDRLGEEFSTLPSKDIRIDHYASSSKPALKLTHLSTGISVSEEYDRNTPVIKVRNRLLKELGKMILNNELTHKRRPK